MAMLNTQRVNDDRWDDHQLPAQTYFDLKRTSDLLDDFKTFMESMDDLRVRPFIETPKWLKKWLKKLFKHGWTR